MRAALPKVRIGQYVIFSLSGSTYMATIAMARVVGSYWNYGVIINVDQKDYVFVHENDIEYAWSDSSWVEISS